MRFFLLAGITGLLLAFPASGCGGGNTPDPWGPAGWAIGSNADGSAVILHTDNGGLDWVAQGYPTQWPGHKGTDISAVNRLTAWATLSASPDGDGGLILHTNDGGATWQVQVEDVPGGMKSIKGVSWREAWAVGLRGPVMHTLDAGRTWREVPTDGIAFTEVNRMDVLGADIWIADHGSGNQGVVHSWDSGRTWRQEALPSPPSADGPMTMTIVNSQVAWTNIRPDADIYRTLDGGVTWLLDAPQVSGPDDIDDLCRVDENEIWAVQNLSGASGGVIMRITLSGSQVKTKDWLMTDYVYEGVSCFDASTAWIAGFRSVGADPGLPAGSIMHTSDGETWTSQPLPVDDVELWKISIVGAGR